jgi:hypothetical protein
MDRSGATVASALKAVALRGASRPRLAVSQAGRLATGHTVGAHVTGDAAPNGDRHASRARSHPSRSRGADLNCQSCLRGEAAGVRLVRQP